MYVYIYMNVYAYMHMHMCIHMWLCVKTCLRVLLLNMGVLQWEWCMMYGKQFAVKYPYPMGASLSDILFSFVLEECIVCDVCGLRSPSFESSSVLYIKPTDTSSMQNLFLQGLQQKLKKSCSRCNKYTCQNICFSSLIDLDTLTIMSPKIDAPYLWIRPLGLAP